MVLMIQVNEDTWLSFTIKNDPIARPVRVADVMWDLPGKSLSYDNSGDCRWQVRV